MSKIRREQACKQKLHLFLLIIIIMTLHTKFLNFSGVSYRPLSHRHQISNYSTIFPLIDLDRYHQNPNSTPASPQTTINNKNIYKFGCELKTKLDHIFFFFFPIITVGYLFLICRISLGSIGMILSVGRSRYLM